MTTTYHFTTIPATDRMQSYHAFTPQATTFDVRVVGFPLLQGLNTKAAQKMSKIKMSECIVKGKKCYRFTTTKGKHIATHSFYDVESALLVANVKHGYNGLLLV